MKNKYLILFIDILILGIIFVVYNNKYNVAKDEEIKDEVSEEIVETALNDTPTQVNNIDSNYYVITNQYKYSDNNYEEQILNHNDEPYKLIEFSVDDYEAYMLVVYDPSNVHLVMSKSFNTASNAGKQNVIDMLKESGAVAGINGGGFFDNGKVTNDTPVGYIIKDGKVLWDTHKKSDLIGFTYDNKLTLIKATAEEAIALGMRDAIEFGPNLIVNGKVNETVRKSNYRAARTILAQREDGIVLMLVTNGGSFKGPKYSSLIEILQNYGAINAANLDGGASSQLVIKDKLYTATSSGNGTIVKNGRKVINGWGVFID